LELDHLVEKVESYDCGFPGHYPLFSRLLTTKSRQESRTVTYRKYSRVNLEEFKTESDVQNSFSTLCDESKNVHQLVELYDQNLSCIIDKHAPLKTRKIPVRLESEWYNVSIRKEKQRRRQLERLWRKTRLSIHRQMYRSQCCVVNKLIEEAKRDYYVTLIKENEMNTKALFRVVNSLLGKYHKVHFSFGCITLGYRRESWFFLSREDQENLHPISAK